MDYKSAGVDIEKAEGLIGKIKNMASSTYDNNVLSGIGGFGALYELKNYQNPVLVSSTDGVGTKILVAQQMNDFSGLGYDLVAMCVDDIVCAGAKPLFFIDYIAVGKLQNKSYLQIMESISNACSESGSALIGGETAELPGMYKSDEFDLAGFSVGVVEKDQILRSDRVKEGDVVIGMTSSGFHSNGFSLIRKIVETKNLDLHHDYGFGVLGGALLSPTHIYAGVLTDVLNKFPQAIHGISHITGGGIPGNLNRILPNGMDAYVTKKGWEIPEIFRFLIKEGGISEEESFKVFNMGIGMALIVKADQAQVILNQLEEKGFESSVIGDIRKGSGKVAMI